MFIRWLFTVFPQEMRLGWAYLRPDLALWLALAALFAVAAMALPPPGQEQQPEQAVLLPYLIAAASALVNMMLPAILFTAQVEGRQLTWGPVVGLMARKAAPLLVYSLIAYVLAFGAYSAMVVAASFALGETPLLVPLTSIAGLVILLSIIVRFSFLPFLVMLLERDQVPETLWQWQRASGLASWFWPLTASARMSEGLRWRLVFYTILAPALRPAVLLLPVYLVLPGAMAGLIIATVVQGVFFEHYRRRCETTGVPTPTLPLEAAVAA